MQVRSPGKLCTEGEHLKRQNTTTTVEIDFY